MPRTRRSSTGRPRTAPSADRSTAASDASGSGPGRCRAGPRPRGRTRCGCADPVRPWTGDRLERVSPRPARTTSGKPLLVNDPHLAPSMPSLWYQVGLHCRTVSPACPFDVAGLLLLRRARDRHRSQRSVAWGFTNLGPDVTDLYLEQLQGDTRSVDGAPAPLTVHDEEIKVAGGTPVTVTIRWTRHGPLLSDSGGIYAHVGTDASQEAFPGADPTARLRRLARMDRAPPRPHGRCPVPHRPGAQLRRLPRRRAPLRGPVPEPRLRRRRRAHRLPGPGPDPDPGRRRWFGSPRPAGIRRTTGPVHPVRRAALGPRPAERHGRDRQPGRRRPRLSPTPDR